MPDPASDRLRTLIVEDNPHSLNDLKNMAAGLPELELIGEAHDGREAVRMIDARKPDLVFLDIELPELNGFEVLETAHHPPLVIFISAYDHYALKAFEANGIDYILKPIAPERLRAAVRKALNRKPGPHPELVQIIQGIIAQEKKRAVKRFAVKSQEQILIIPQEEVCFFKAEDKYVFLHTNDKQYFYNATLKDLETTLDPDRFNRVNKSYIVAVDKIEKIKKTLDHGYKIILNDFNKTAVKISPNYVERLKKQFNLR